MAYEVTATRRRPQRFEDMIGQDFVVATLQKSVAAGKIAHAYLFSGPRGCGKTSSARILAKALNCETGPGATPCGVCPSCIEVTRGGSLDVIEIDGASNTSVNDVRQIKEEVQFPPNSCRYKVYIIDEVHMLSTSAFNALLKTIEEPPPYVIFIFATTEIHKVPATIKSRCQQFNFRLVSVDQLKEVLSTTADEMGIHSDTEALFWIAREATGSVRDAYTLFDQVAAFSDGHITFEKIRDKLGLVGVERINTIAEACAARNICAALTSLDETLQTGVSVEQFTVDMADYFRNLLLLRSGITKEALLGQNSDRFSQIVLKEWSQVQIERALGIVLQLFRDIRYSIDPRYELELALSRLSWITDYVSSSEMKSAITQAKGLLQRNGVPQDRPFNQADRFTGQKEPETVRGNDGSSNNQMPDPGSPKESAGSVFTSASNAMNMEEDGEVRIENPFAAFKQRLNGNVDTPIAEKTVPPAALGYSVEDRLEESPETDSEPLPAIKIEGVKDALVSFFQASKNMVATSLSNSFDWMDTGSLVHFSVDKPFVHNFLEQEHKALAEAVSKCIGRQTAIEIHLDATRNAAGEEENEKKTIPSQVEMIQHMFKGTIVGEGR